MIWIDAQLSSHLAPWLGRRFNVEAFSLEYLGLDEAEDETVFAAAREADVIVMTKDEDFVRLQKRLGAPPKLVWIMCGNTSNAYLREVLTKTFNDALTTLGSGDVLVETCDAVR